jgi:hypothetical protein
VRRRKRGELPRMILDKKMCLRVEAGDEQWAEPTTPHYCPLCGTRKFSGKLRYGDGPVPTCDDHDPVQVMVPR